MRTSNPIESVFSGVRLRTNASKRLHVRENALYLCVQTGAAAEHELARHQRAQSTASAAGRPRLSRRSARAQRDCSLACGRQRMNSLLDGGIAID